MKTNDISRLFDFIYYQQANCPSDRSFNRLTDDGIQSFSTNDVISRSEALAKGLMDKGVKQGDKIAMTVYKNRPEWLITDLATQMIGAVNVPVYPTISPREYSYIFKEAEVCFCFVGGGDLLDKVRHAKQDVKSLKEIFTYEKTPGQIHWSDLCLEGNTNALINRRNEIKPSDLATIIYTSGTTGNPKGVMLSHNNIVSNVMAVEELIPLSRGQSALSFLPLCHIFERAVSYAYMLRGIEVYHTGTDNLGGGSGDLSIVKPHFFTAVPRLLEKVYEKIYKKGLNLSGVKKYLFFWALSLTENYAYDKTYQGLEGLKWKIADKLIFSKWRQALGGNIAGILSGAAPLPEKIARIFSAAGIPIREGYGLTETSPGLTIGRFDPKGAMLGTVGMPIKGINLYIDKEDGVYTKGEGEILARGPNIMMGYYKKPKETAEVMKEVDGQTWFCTGDVGKLIHTDDGRTFLKITDRKKELLRTSNGKYVAPAPIESKLKEDFLVEQAMVVGESRNFVSALIIPSELALRDWCIYKGIPWSGISEAIKLKSVKGKFQRIIDDINPLFSHIEQIKKFTLIHANWEPIKKDKSDAELTPTLKLKRRVIRLKYKKEIEGMYES